MLNDVVYSLQQFILNNVDEPTRTGLSLNQTLEPYGNPLVDVYSWDKYNVGSFDLPCLVMGDLEESSRWLAAPYQMLRTYSGEMNGYMTFADTEDSGESIRDFADVFRALFEGRRFAEIPLLSRKLFKETGVWDTGNTIYFQSEGDNAPPIKKISITVDDYGEGQLLRLFQAELTCYVTETIAQE